MSIVLQGSTSGSVTLQEPAVAGTTVLTLPAVSGTVLTDTSPKAGNVIQVVQGTYATGVSITSSSYVDLGLSASITPTSSSSKILVIVSVQGLYLPSGGSNNDCIGVKLLRGSTDINIMAGQLFYRNSTSVSQTSASYASYLDSPATTSSTTYKIQWRTENSRPVNVNVGGETSTITLLEIAA